MKIKGINKAMSSQAFGWMLIGGGAILAYYIIKKVKNTTISVVNSISYQGTSLTSQRVMQLASQIKGAWGFFNDDEEAVYSAMRFLKNEMDWNYLVATYNTGGSDMIKDITKYMNAKERQKINNILIANGISAKF